jgi:hypothetical protein
MVFVVVITPHEGFALGFCLCVFVNDVVGEVEVIRDGYLEVLVEVFVRFVIRAG